MRFKSVLPIIAGLVILQSCSTTKNDVLWVGGFKTECDSGAGKTECLKVFNGDNFENEQWENLHANIEGFDFEEGYMKRIEVQKNKLDSKDTAENDSLVKYTLIKELEKKKDPRFELKGNWVLASINGANLNRMIVLPTLNFNLEEMTILGNGGCNLYSASIEELTSKNIQITQALATLKECENENIEQEYQKALSEIKEYSIDKDILSLSDGEGNIVLTFVKVEVPKSNPLAGEWKAMRVKGKTVDIEIIPTMIFDFDKMTVNGRDGCNYYYASIKSLTDSDIIFENAASTQTSCVEMEIPDLFSKALNEVVTYHVSDQELILLDDQGNELMVFSK